MTTADRLYNLLPVIYRQRDTELGNPVQMLLRVIAEQVDLVEGDISQLYDNWFIETCQDWVVPYLADLIGYRPVHPLADTADQDGLSLNDVLVPRREVANTIEYRRRKGTLALLEDIGGAVTGWPARAVEFERHISASQALDHLHLTHGRFADLRAVESLDLLGSPFDPLSHTVDIRVDLKAVESSQSPGRYNIANVAVYLWRLQIFALTRAPAYCLEEAGDHCFTFSILGNDMPLFTSPVPRTGHRTPQETEVPGPIRRRPFEQRTELSGAVHVHASKEYYGEGKSVVLWAPGWAGTEPGQPIPAEKVIPADLSEWKYQAKPGQVAVDPQLGRISFPPSQLPAKGVMASFFYGFGSNIGGGEYPREVVLQAKKVATYPVGPNSEFTSIHAAYERWAADKPAHAAIEITDSGVYQEPIDISLPKGHSLELRAANGARPVIFLVDWHATRADALTVQGAQGSEFTLDGILVAGRGIEVRGGLGSLTIRHSTLVPGWTLHHDCTPRRPGEPSLVLMNTSAEVDIRNSILGGIQVIQEAHDVDPLSLRILDSILDAPGRESLALGSPDESVAPAALTIQRCTVFGQVQAHSIALAENCIFNGRVLVARRQQGCMRFCYVPGLLRTPMRFHCQPDLADQAAAQRAKAEGLDLAETAELRRAERLRVVPDFLSVSYGSPNFCRLASNCAVEIAAGADDQSEMGVFHDLFQPQRVDNLRTRLLEYTPAGVDTGVIFAT